MRIPLQKVLWLVFLWSEHTAVSSASRRTSISKKSVLQIYQYRKDICSWKLQQNQELLGGPVVIYQIEKSCFKTRPKHQCGRNRGELWVFGIADTSRSPVIGHMGVVSSARRSYTPAHHTPKCSYRNHHMVGWIGSLPTAS